MVFLDLIELYESEGFQIRTSISPFLLRSIEKTSDQDGTCTYIHKDGVNWGAHGGGISMSEVYFFETIAAHKQAARVFGIGCSFGWSTLALALSHPRAKVVAIDIATGTSAHGLELTNRLAARRGLDVKAIVAASPDGVAPVVAAEFDGPIDLVFIDADHNDAAQLADFEAVRPFLAPDAVVLFHDVYVCAMRESFGEIARRMPTHEARVLSRTASGIGAVIPRSGHDGLRREVAAFADPFAPLPI